MQSPASDRACSPDRYVVRLSGALAALLDRAEGAELPEDELLGALRTATLALSTEMGMGGAAAAAASVLAALLRPGGGGRDKAYGDAVLLGLLREQGLVTYPSPLLGRLLEEWRDVLVKEVLAQLDPTDCAVLAEVAKPWLAVVVANNLPRAGKVLEVGDFVGSVERLAWAKANDCSWTVRTCALAARSGHVEVLRWAREHGCEWDESTCAEAAEGGHLAVLMWARQHGCQWEENIFDYPDWDCCALAAKGGHLEVLKWLREQDCPWDAWTCAWATGRGHLDVLKWAREHHCPWDARTRQWAEEEGHLALLQWAVEHGAPV